MYKIKRNFIVTSKESGPLILRTSLKNYRESNQSVMYIVNRKIKHKYSFLNGNTQHSIIYECTISRIFDISHVLDHVKSSYGTFCNTLF